MMTVPADWHDFAEVIGSASGALTGLLFVAVSLNASRIEEYRGLRASAAQTLVLFLTPLIMAAALLAPGQANWVFGAELIAIGLIASWVLLSIGRLKQTLDDALAEKAPAEDGHLSWWHCSVPRDAVLKCRLRTPLSGVILRTL